MGIKNDEGLLSVFTFMVYALRFHESPFPAVAICNGKVMAYKGKDLFTHLLHFSVVVTVPLFVCLILCETRSSFSTSKSCSKHVSPPAAVMQYGVSAHLFLRSIDRSNLSPHSRSSFSESEVLSHCILHGPHVAIVKKRHA